jgi:GT2 family glycosyltransferase
VNAARPGVDVVVPFRGTDTQLEALLADLAMLKLGSHDSLVVVDNGPAGRRERELGANRSVIVETDVASSYYARNRGAARGSADWLVFLDADVRAPADLLDLYFERAPAERDGVLAGAVIDERSAPAGLRNPAARYAYLRSAMSQDNTLSAGEWSYAQTANCAVRRAAFEAVEGFRTDVRSGGDADLCFRLGRAGWALGVRGSAGVVHLSRTTLRAMLRQRARHGSGARWLNGVYPGSFPADLSIGTVWWSVKQTASAIGALARGQSDRAILLGVEVLSHWAFELGRLAPNEVHRSADAPRYPRLLARRRAARSK